MANLSNHQLFNCIWFRWLARFILLAATLAAFVLSFFPSQSQLHYIYSELAEARIGPEVSTVLTLPLLLIGAVAWFRPRPGGLLAVAWCLAALAARYMFGHDTVIYFPLFSLILAGGVLHLFLPERVRLSATTARRLSVAAAVISFAAPVCFLFTVILVLTLQLPAGLGTGLFYSVLAIILALFALHWPLAGGTAIVFFGGMLFSGVLITDHYPMYYVPVAGLSIMGGALHLIRAAK